MNTEQLLKKINDKLTDNTSDLEKIVYTDAIQLLNNEVNPDKVNNWINQTINIFNNKPQPLSDKEIMKREQKKIRKEKKKNDLILTINNVKEFLSLNGIVAIGFFDYKDFRDREYNKLNDLVRIGGYFLEDIGDGAHEPFISTNELDDDFFNQYHDLIGDLDNDTWNTFVDTDFLTLFKKVEDHWSTQLG